MTATYSAADFGPATTPPQQAEVIPAFVPTVRAALDFGAAGWPVFPVNPATKAPSNAILGLTDDMPGGCKAATTDPNRISEMFARVPGAMVAIATGARSGIWVLDVDRPDHAGHAVDGGNTLATLIAEHGPLPDTIEASTAGSGRHIYFAWDAENPVSNSIGSLPPASGLDVRGEGGYVVAPPSVRADGQQYRWTNPPGLFDAAPAPAWLLRMVITKPSVTVPAPVAPDPRPGGIREQFQQASGAAILGSGSGFFRSVNDSALANIMAWAPALYPHGQAQLGTGAWRVSSRALGRGLQEDLFSAEVAADAARIVREFILPHAYEFYRTAETVTDGDRLQKVASYVLTCGKTRLVASDFCSNVAHLKGLTPFELSQKIGPLVAGGWLQPEDSSPQPRAWITVPGLADCFERRAIEERQRKEKLAELMNPKRAAR